MNTTIALSNPYPRQKGGKFGPGPGKAGSAGSGKGEGKAPTAKGGGASRGKAGGGGSASETRASHDLLAGKTVLVRNEEGNHFLVNARQEGEGSYRVEVRRADYLGRVGAAQQYGGGQRYSPSQTARLTTAQIQEASHGWQHVSSHDSFQEGLRAIRKTPDAMSARLGQLNRQIETLRHVTDPQAKHYRTPSAAQMAKYHQQLKSAEKQAAKLEKALANSTTSETSMAITSPASTWQPTDLTTVRLADGGDGFKRSWIMILPEGEFEHPKWGKLDLTRRTLDEMVQNFNERARGIDIALDYDHKASSGDSRAPGWIEAMEVRPAKAGAPAGLWAKVRWTPIGLQDIKDQIYRYVSAEFKEDYEDNVSGDKHHNVIIGATLTNRPFMKQMPAVKLKDYSQAQRDAMDDSDFAGPHESFPIKTQADVHNAARLIGHADDPAAVKAAIIRIAKRKGFSLPAAWADEDSGEDSDTKAASERSESVTTSSSRKLADDELPAGDDEQEQEDDLEVEEPADDADESDEDEDSEESDEDEPEGAQGVSTLSEMMEHITGRKTLAAPTAASKPTPKKGRKPLPPSDDEDEDGDSAGADDDADAMDDSEDESYDESSVHIPGEMKIGKQSTRPTKAAAKMSETVVLAEQVARLTEQLAERDETIKTLREAAFKTSVATRLAEMTKYIRVSDDVPPNFGLSRSFRKTFESFMFDEGVKLSEATLDKLNGLILHALRHGTVPLTSLATQGEQPVGVVSLDDRRPRVASKDPGEASKQRLAEAKAIALSEGVNYDDLDSDGRLVYIARVRSRASGHGEPGA